MGFDCGYNDREYKDELLRKFYEEIGKEYCKVVGYTYVTVDGIPQIKRPAELLKVKNASRRKS